MRDEILSALLDSNNSFYGNSGGFDFAALDTDKITANAWDTGVIGNLQTMAASTTPSGGITVSGATLTGGTGVEESGFIASPPRDLLVHDLFVQGVVGEGINATEFFTVTKLEIDGVTLPNITGENNTAVFGGRYPNTPVNLDVSAEEGVPIEITLQTPGTTSGGASAALFCRPA
jgi:hypothetical protein